MKLQQNENDEFCRMISSDDSIFHYTKRALAIEKIFQEDKLVLSSPIKSNDPFEYKSKLIGAGGWGWDDDTEVKANETRKILEGLLARNTQYISCCSNSFIGGKLESYGCAKPRMWAQYGENHEGVCLVFSKIKLVNALRAVCGDNGFFVWDGFVSYPVNHALAQISVNRGAFDKSSPAEVAIEHINSNHRQLLFSKPRDYRDESEYRAVVLNRDTSSTFSSPLALSVSEFLVGIILSDRFPKVYYPVVNEISKTYRIEVKRLHWVRGKYALLDMG